MIPSHDDASLQEARSERRPAHREAASGQLPGRDQELGRAAGAVR